MTSNTNDDYCLQVQTRDGGRRWGGQFRAWAFESAVQDADYVAKEMYDGEVVVMDTRVWKVAYSTRDGHANWKPEGSEPIDTGVCKHGYAGPHFRIAGEECEGPWGTQKVA